MMATKLLSGCLTVLFAGALLADDLEGVKCVVMHDHDASPKVSIEYRDAKIYFCCEHCLETFNEDKEKYAARANHQLVQTKQYVQRACPMMDKPVEEGFEVTIAEVTIGLCCRSCQTRLNRAADDDARIEMAFGDKVFEKAYERKIDEAVDLTDVICIVGGGPASADHSAAFGPGRVYFCCGSCAEVFAEDAGPYATKANHQLAITGQVAQTACPLTGRNLAEGTDLTVGGIAVRFCCNNCRGRVASAEDDAKRAELVFGATAFEKGFARK